MNKRILICAMIVAGVLSGFVPGEASWTKPNKKKITPYEGFKNSANGFVSNVLPWNWFGAKESRPQLPAYVRRNDGS